MKNVFRVEGFDMVFRECAAVDPVGNWRDRALWIDREEVQQGCGDDSAWDRGSRLCL